MYFNLYEENNKNIMIIRHFTPSSALIYKKKLKGYKHDFDKEKEKIKEK